MLTRLLLSAVLIAFAVTSLIPAGWMLERADDGKILVVLCTADGPQEQLIDLGGEPEQPAGQTDSYDCPFANWNTPKLSAGIDIEHRLNFPVSAQWPHEAFTHHSAGFHWRYDARGPPNFS